ncbi:hypothetical protein AGABI1DRAFT_125780 [Agaricus bisporus var. burnettii JB137-S8]|uniref:F-box domain-containing protein n=1 Tax=Agaricus bisporus var. burnettii (strain JB137-S8 / ATCC MYA-4627 / FGSC 10392) TaxID=597362 RepID=K5X617_AGABU|nr:uncharacterized protein AGABI1DRAFT_125780 [Agaricus bisporus var. burnettii JB137-S8]EKM83326.1 hypothetical protein AGABI1DRAFT_125780 [Agaricus bisporus var. burnettii JB137-S8]
MPLLFMNQVTSFFNPKDRISAEMSSLTLPFDVWREVIQHLPLHALLSICLVNKIFYFYAQPFIFEHFVVRPKGQLKTLAASFRKSLEFLQSPRIAWAVRHFHVDLSAFPHTKMVQSASDIVLGEFADCASAFPNLRRFTFVSVYINLPVLSKLQRLLVPFTLALKSCIFASELTKTNLDIPINDLRFTDSSPFMEYATPRRRYPELFLRTEHLKSIVAGKEYAETALIEMADSIRPFTRLTHLEFPTESCCSSHLIAVLSLCPNLEVLKFNGRVASHSHLHDSHTRFPATFLPKLTSFTGPLVFVNHLFLSNQLSPRHDLRSITICLSSNFSLHASDRSDCIEGDLFGTLNLLPDTITTLNFVALPLLGPEGLLTQIQGATLKHLGVNCDPHYYVQCLRPDQFVKCLRESRDKIPDTLEELTIGIQIKDPFKCKKKELMVKQEAEILSETSFGTIPNLRTLKVWYWAKPAPRWVTWGKQVNGRIDAFWQRP